MLGPGGSRSAGDQEGGNVALCESPEGTKQKKKKGNEGKRKKKNKNNNKKEK